MCGWQVKLCDPLVTHGPYLSALEVQHDEALYKSTFTLLYVYLQFVGHRFEPTQVPLVTKQYNFLLAKER